MSNKPNDRESGLDERLLLLAPEDNVVVTRTNLPAGAGIVIDGTSVTLDAEAPAGFKLARKALSKGMKIVKYGAPIGSATCDIAPGALVHLHNMKSDYIELDPEVHGNAAREGEV